MPALSVKKRSQRGENHFWRAFLACRLGLGLFARPHNDPVIRINSYTPKKQSGTMPLLQILTFQIKKIFHHNLISRKAKFHKGCFA